MRPIDYQNILINVKFTYNSCSTSIFPSNKKMDGRPLYRPTIHAVLPNYTIYYLKKFYL